MLHAMSVALLLSLAAPGQAPDPAAKIAPVIEETVSAMIHLDLTDLDVKESLRELLGPAADDEEAAEAMKDVTRWADGLKATGAKDLFILIDLTDIPAVPTAAVPVANEAEGLKVAKFLKEGVPGIAFGWPAAETVRGVVLASKQEIIDRILRAKPADRPGLSAALKDSPDSRVQIALAPSAVQRKALEEAMPTLPKPLGGGPIGILTRGMQWASLALTFEPKPIVRIVLQGKDADAAKALQKVAKDGLNLAAGNLKGNPETAPLADAVGQMNPAVEVDRVILSADLQNASALVAVPVRQARESARRSQCVNNLKQIGLAMHNYHSKHDSLPPAFTASKDGKALLSWRVLILPYLEQEELYKQFHLDESWDSPHNKTLISKMPAFYACPSGKKSTAADGKTSYLTARGPATIFPGSTGIKFKEITDGLSNTIMVVDANNESAVIWTKPDDWTMPDPFDTKGLLGHHPGGVNVGFGDGSVRFVKASAALQIWHALFTRNGGEVFSWDEF
jgi:prepilin-type processing-associated H-X9-DG protein